MKLEPSSSFLSIGSRFLDSLRIRVEDGISLEFVRKPVHPEQQEPRHSEGENERGDYASSGQRNTGTRTASNFKIALPVRLGSLFVS